MSDAELTDPLGRLLPGYSLGAELIRPRGGGTGSDISDSNIAETLQNRPNLLGVDQEQAIGDAVNAAHSIPNFINQNVKIDNPATSRGATDWLQNKVKHAETSMNQNDPRTSSGKGLVGSTTAWSEMNVPTQMLENLQGAYNEKRTTGVPGFDNLLKKVKKEGWNPDPISVTINHKGQPYIYEGNTRVAVAKALGIPNVPAKIQWLNGAENVPGDWHMENFAKNMLSNPDITKAKGGRTLGNNAIDNALRLATGGRAHFDDGGDARAGDSVGGLKGDTGGYSGDRGNDDNARADSVSQSEQRSADSQRESDNRAYNQDVGRFSFGNNFNVGNTNETGVSMPSNFQDYTQQRLDAENNYQGSLLNAAMYPSQAFGMSYPNLVNVENTRAGAAGLLGSGMGESGKGLDPSAMNAGSIGMFQETGPRAEALKAALGIDPSLRGNALRDALAGTQMGQLGFGLNEIVSKPDYAATARAMASGTNAADVANTVMRNFERPSEANQILSGPMREAYAQNIMAGRPSGATLGIGSYDVAPSSYMAALMSGVKQADLQNQATPHQYANDATLAQSVMSDASNDPAVTAARNAVLAGGQDSTTANQPNILERIFGSTQDQIDKLAAEGKYAGMDKQQYADQFAGGDPNAVKERIIYDNGQPKVDYYTKDLSQALFGDPLKALTSGLGNLFAPKSSYDPTAIDKGMGNIQGVSSANNMASPFGNHGGGQQNVINQALAAAAPQSVTAPYITQLGTYNAQLPSTSGQTAEQWAKANTGGDMSKVYGRIKYVNGAPMLEYYTQ